MLDLAARAALRASGDVEPNPLVGCVLARPPVDERRRDDPGAWSILSIGHHRRFGGAHGEIDALRRCRDLGLNPAGAVAFVNLEPCNHHGKTPPCTSALIDARLREVVFAQADPHALAAGGAAALRAAGVLARRTDASPLARSLAEPFLRRWSARLPWVIAKWAATAEGSLVAPGGGPRRPISCPASLRRVHRLRARVDGVLIGVGTALADDPLLTARDTARIRRTARRIVLDSSLRLPPESELARTARGAPVELIGASGACERFPERAGELRARGVRIVEATAASGGAGLALQPILARLSSEGVHTLLVEPGPTLLRSLLADGLIDEAWVFLAGLAHDREGAIATAARTAPALADPSLFSLCAPRRSGADAFLTWRRPARA